jgi:hypothetical protein
MRRLVTAALAAVLLLATTAQAADQAAAAGPHGGTSLVGWAILGWGSSVGVGGSFQLPLAPKGLIHDPGFKLRDSLDLDLGVDYLNYYDHHYAGPYAYDVSEFNLHAGVIWNFWLTPQVAVYPKVGLGYSIAHYTYSPGWNPSYGHGDYGGLYPEVAVGAQFALSRALSLRGELGWAGLKVGLGFAF